MRQIEELRAYPAIHRIFGLFQEQRDAVFLDSSLKNRLGQYSIIGLYPYLKLVNGGIFTANGEQQACSFEEYLSRYLAEHREKNETGLPIISGAVGYFSYDYGRKKEGVPSCHNRDLRIPECILCFYDVFIVEDHSQKRLYLVANGRLQEAGRRLRLLKERIFELNEPEEKQFFGESGVTITSNFKKEEYLKAVEDVIHYITEGDIYIANLTQQLRINSSRPPYEVFKRLRANNPSPFGGYFNYGNFQVISASPERFLSMNRGHVVTRPIKGTRRRGRTPGEDDLLRRELQDSQKDKSELLMIVDLERNDLNRVCIPGSVRVSELFAVEEYATVFHLVSTVEGDLEEGKTVVDLLRAGFPGGSITGAPKLRAMEIIDEMEHSRRNLYTGSMGYLTLDGSCDFNIVIRTALHQNGCYYLGVGGGITCESEPEFEYEETLQKAKAILEALS